MKSEYTTIVYHNPNQNWNKMANDTINSIIKHNLLRVPVKIKIPNGMIFKSSIIEKFKLKFDDKKFEVEFFESDRSEIDISGIKLGIYCEAGNIMFSYGLGVLP